MSASLVGSEMCIRDRPNAGGGLMRPPRARRGAPADDDHPAAQGGRARTVSYTHLTLPTICSV
eukprot:4319644-Alexandrium_andersonii.AAC.1